MQYQNIIESIENFKVIDKDFLRKSRNNIISTVSNFAAPPQGINGRAAEKTELFLVNSECAKKRAHISIRSLLRRAGGTLLAYKPCFMMSPLSVAHYLKPGSIEFDLVIMDEASQIRPEDSLGAIARGKQIVIVGDSQQLPPTSFFSNMLQGVDEEAESDDDIEEAKSSIGVESILDLAQNSFPHRYLRWHYRSVHESLIAFSNRHFYSDRLHLFPSPHNNSDSLGIKLLYVECGVFEDGENLEEANKVVQLLVKVLREKTGNSIGVATMNKKQQDLIQRLIDDVCKNDSTINELISATEASNEPMFIKNLENVQGDERDIIIVSTTYGLERKSNQVFQRFGPINSQGGSRRLNVVFSRARKQMFIVTSLRSNQILESEKTSEGARAFKAFLEFAEAGGILPPNGIDTGRETDSVFEDEVISILSENGYYCVPQVGVSGFYIDIGVKLFPNSDKYVMGIECDGATYHSHPSIRDRDRIRQDILESKGWNIYRIWSTNWFNNREREIKRILITLNELKKKTMP
jgi:hypothetical protein